jgi:hypothetical protein
MLLLSKTPASLIVNPLPELFLNETKLLASAPKYQYLPDAL